MDDDRIQHRWLGKVPVVEGGLCRSIDTFDALPQREWTTPKRPRARQRDNKKACRKAAACRQNIIKII